MNGDHVVNDRLHVNQKIDTKKMTGLSIYDPSKRNTSDMIQANEKIVQILLVTPVSKTLWKTLNYESSTRVVEKMDKGEDQECNDTVEK